MPKPNPKKNEKNVHGSPGVVEGPDPRRSPKMDFVMLTPTGKKNVLLSLQKIREKKYGEADYASKNLEFELLYPIKRYTFVV